MSFYRDKKLNVGFIINPIAGMGGTVGLKGTDGLFEEAIRRGAKPIARARAILTLEALKGMNIHFFACSGEMGENALFEVGLTDYSIVYKYSGNSSAADTIKACQEFILCHPALLLFCGGDGTARDVYSVVGDQMPIIGIPAGVKMYSAVFAVNPIAVADVIKQLSAVKFRDSEVVDVNEEAYRQGELTTQVFGFARVPYIPERMQMRKYVFEESDDERAKDDIARFIIEIMRDDTTYVIGAGTTTARIASCLGLEKTLLGIDVIKNYSLIAKDTDESALLSILDKSDHVKIIVSPLGAQGFVLGRGTQSISPRVLRKVGTKNLLVIGTPHKLAETPVLYVDTGDTKLDQEFENSILVISGYRIGQRKKLRHE